MRELIDKAGKRAFTLVEMLVVIAIISVVAMASVNAIRGAQRQARSAKCQSNMHALYKAVSAYRADHSCFPPAAGYEWYDSRMDQYHHVRGWVNWVLNSGAQSRKKSPGNPYYSGDRDGSPDSDKSTHASAFIYAGTGCNSTDYKGASGKAPNYSNVSKSAVYRSIDEGALFVYADKSFSIYCCDEFKNRYGKQCMRSYAMNILFGAPRKDPRDTSKSLRLSTLQYDSPGFANRLALFVELGNAGQKSSSKDNHIKDLGTLVGGAAGVAGSASTPDTAYGDDSAWDWDKNHQIGLMHYKSGKLYGHVLFADGHLESLPLQTNAQLGDLGKGTYGN